MNEPFHFETRDEFCIWLMNHCMSGGSTRLKFEKSKNTVFKAGDALEEALCFGQTDGVMKRIDDGSYIKYFSVRRRDSKWSEKNKVLAEDLEKRGLITDFGREKIQEVRKNGQWDKPSGSPAVTAEQIGATVSPLEEHEPAYANFQKIPPPVQKIYTRACYDARTDDGHARRFAWMAERPEENLKPM